MDSRRSAASERLAEVRRQVVETLLEIDVIKLQVNPRILAEYAKTIGYLETDLYKWQLRARRSRRKFALAQAAANRGEVAAMDAIEQTLDAEFAEWEAKLSSKIAEQLEFAEKLAESRPLSPSETRELKALHKKLIKRLHPDLHPNLSEEAQRFFLIAQTAYEHGDIQMLRMVDTATEDYEGAHAEAELSDDELEIELALAEAQLVVSLEQLETLKRSYPYILTELLNDPVRLSERKRELEQEIEQQKRVARAYEEKIAKLMGGEGL